MVRKSKMLGDRARPSRPVSCTASELQRTQDRRLPTKAYRPVGGPNPKIFPSEHCWTEQLDTRCVDQQWQLFLAEVVRRTFLKKVFGSFCAALCSKRNLIQPSPGLCIFLAQAWTSERFPRVRQEVVSGKKTIQIRAETLEFSVRVTAG